MLLYPGAATMKRPSGPSNTTACALGALLIVVLCVCQKSPQSPVIARVGKQVMTLEDLYKSIPPEYSHYITRDQMVNYVKQWIDTELLFAEAMRRKINTEKEIQQRIEKMKKDLLSAEIINRCAIASTPIQIPEAAIQAYYDARKHVYIRESDVIKYIEIVVDSLKTAWAVRNQVTEQNFLDLASQYSKIPVPDPRGAPSISVNALPPGLKEVILQIRVMGTTAPIPMADGFHILRVLDKQKAGTTCDLDEVREEIVNTLTTEAHNKEIEALLSGLRLKMDYEFHFDRIPDKTATDSDVGAAPEPLRDSTTRE
jgi:hypothetical protein